MTHRIDDWRGLYSEGWQGEITPDAFSHPAKFSRALIRAIYDHAAAEGWVEPGAVVVDPFGGVALGALDAMRLGLTWIGCELEAKFVDLGRDNIALWSGRYGPHLPGWGCAHLLQGDSRQLADRLAGAGLCVSSPPYAGNEKSDTTHIRRDERRLGDGFAGRGRGCFRGSENYGSAPGQLGAMREGDLSLAISSPPWSQTGVPDHEGQTDTLKGGKFQGGGDRFLYTNYGNDPANLGNMASGDLGAALAVSSPPFAQQQTGGGLAKPDARYIDGTRIGSNCGYQNQGTTPGNLASMTVSSPPYAGSQVQQSHGQSWREELTDAPGSWRSLGIGYGSDPGQLGAMHEGDHGAALTVSSPPYEGSAIRNDADYTGTKLEDAKRNGQTATRATWGHNAGSTGQWMYGDAPGQLGGDTGNTFWTAARTIVEQTYQVLKPGGHAVWVVKAFVRNKQRVDFPGQWRALCEACGFVTLHEHRAWLVEEHPAQLDLWGNGHAKRVERKSFFRRLAESKGSPRIDWETVYCMVKPD